MTAAQDDLTIYEASLLAELEDVIDRGFTTFLQVGTALATIRDDRLYRSSHDTFEDYCRARWQISRPRAYQLIEAASVAEQMSTFVDIPPVEIEAHARALAPIVKAKGAEAAAELLRSIKGKVTAKAIKAKDDTPRDDPETEQAVQDWISSDPNIRKANLRKDFSRWVLHLSEWYTFDPAEMAEVYPEKAEDVAELVGRIDEWTNQYVGRVRGARLSIVKETRA